MSCILTIATPYLRRCLLMLAILTLPIPAMKAGEIVIVKKERSKYAIRIVADAPESVSEAASELSRLIQKSTGVRLPVTHEYRAQGKYIFIGKQDLAHEPSLEGLAHDAFIMKELDGNIWLTGNDEIPALHPGGHLISEEDSFRFYNLSRWQKSLSAGSYNAVIQFARDYLGARWYMPGELGEEVHVKEVLQIPEGLNQKVEPWFTQRRFDFTNQNSGMAEMLSEGDPDAYYNLDLFQGNLEWGRRLRHTNSLVNANGHGWRIWIPANEMCQEEVAELGDFTMYGQTHPEFFALVNGERQVRYHAAGQQGGQLCVSNPELIREYANNIIKVAKREPSRRMFSLCQNDGGTHCECENCRAWDVDTLLNQGLIYDDSNLTDRIMRFQKEVARLVLEEIPDARFTVMAYHATGNAPSREEVPSCFNIQGYYNYLPNRYHINAKKSQLQTALEGWGKASDHFYFSTFFNAYGNHSFPWSAVDVIDWTLSTLKENNIRGFEIYQGMFGEVGQPLVGQLGPDTWLASQLLWDPSQSVETLLNDWYSGCFGGEIGPFIRAYYELIEDRFAEEVRRFPNFWENRSQKQLQIDLNVYTDIREECSELIEMAEMLAGYASESIQWRVKQVATSWHFTELTLDTWQAFRDTRFAETDEAMDKAIALARKREMMIHDPENRYSIEPAAVYGSAEKASLGIITEKPKSILPRIFVPKVKLDVDQLPEPADPLWNDSGASIGTGEFRFRNNYNRQEVIAGTSTEGRIFYTDKGLYCMLHAQEPDMAQLVISDDPDLPWKGDVMELFLVPGEGSGGHFQFMVNPVNDALNVAFRDDTGADRAYSPRWEHRASLGADGWTVQMFIPWEALGAKPGKGDLWLANFCRERYTATHEDSAWSPTEGVFALPNKFGKLIFK